MKGNTTIVISPKTLFLATAIVLGLYTLYVLKDLVLVLLTSIVIASAIEPAVDWFKRYHVPRVVAVITVYATIIGFFAGLIGFFIPPVLDEMSGFLDILPTYLEQVSISNPMTGEVVHDEAGAVFSLRDGVIELRNALTNASDGFVQTVSIVFGGFVSFVLIIIFSFYFSVQDKGIDDFLRLVVPAKYTNKVLDLWKRSQKKIGLWMQGQLLLGLIVGVLTYLGLTVLGVRYSLLFAIIAGLLEIIPLFGPVLASIPAIALAFVDGGPSLGFLVIGLYLIIQQFENHLIHPLVVSKVVGVPPILIILSLLVGGHLAGFLGIILAVPLAAVLQELVAEISRERASLNSAPKSA